MTQEVIEILDLTILSYISFRSLKSLSPSIFYIINIGINAFMNKKKSSNHSPVENYEHILVT
jgi:hypothetical protein